MAYSYYNPNPTGKRVGDCAIRAVAKALNTDWNTAYALVASDGYCMGDLPSSDAVWGATLRSNGFEKHVLPNTCPDCYTAGQFALDYPNGVYVLAFGGHVATIVDGVLYDSWDSSNEIPIYYFRRS